MAAGPGSVSGSASGLVAGVLKTTVSVGSLMLSIRTSDVTGIFTGPRGVREAAMLAGVRTGGRRAFASAALGLSRAQEAHGVGLDCGPSRDCPYRTAVAFDLGVHANLLVPGVHAAFTGVAGPSKVSYTAVVVGLELGWFGQ